MSLGVFDCPPCEFACLGVLAYASDPPVDARLKRGRKYVPVGQGQVDWFDIFDNLRRSGYDGVVCLETHHNCPDGRRESAAKASFAGLRGVYRQVMGEQASW